MNNKIKDTYDAIMAQVPTRSLNFADDNNGRLSLKVCLEGISYDVREADPIITLMRVLPQLEGKTVSNVQFSLLPDDEQSNPNGSYAEIVVEAK